MSERSRSEPYPRYCFHLSPTANAWCPLRAVEVHALTQHPGFEGEGFYFFRKLPIKWVRAVGVVVAVDEFYGRRVYTIDDSSGACIEACAKAAPERAGAPKQATRSEKHVSSAAGTKDEAKAAPAAGAYEAADVGAVVDVKGSVSMFRDEKQITIERMTVLKSTAQEVALWEKRRRFLQEVLDKPWVLQDRDVRRCRQEAEAAEAKVRRSRDRAQRAAGPRQPGEAAPEQDGRGAVEAPRGTPRADDGRRWRCAAASHASGL